MPSLYFIIGPSAVGKSELALALAERMGAELLYCDASCVYRGMDIGTAKPTSAERARVPHHGLDLVDADKPFTIGDYVDYARHVVEDCARRAKPLIISGGSGFYARSFFHPVIDSTEPDAAVRERVRGMSPEEALAELCSLNPEGVKGLDLQNPRRVQAALERCLASGRPLALLQADYRAQPEPYAGYEKHLCLLSRSREDLHERIALRTRQMLDAGLVEEVRRLRAEGFEANASAAGAIGYRETLRWLSEESGDTSSLAEEIAHNTRRLVKKQNSFFRNQLPQGHTLLLPPGGTVDASLLFA